MGIAKENFEEHIIKYYLNKCDVYNLKIKNVISETHYEAIKKYIEQNTDIFSVFHYQTTSLFAIKDGISYWLVCEIYSKRYAIINSNKEVILPFNYYKTISTTENKEYIICNEKLLFDFNGNLIKGNLINNNKYNKFTDKKAATIRETIKNTTSHKCYPLKCLIKYYDKDINKLATDIKKLENSNIPHSIFDYNGSKFFTDGDVKKYFALKEKDRNKWGLINIDGKLLSPFVYDDLGGFVVGEGSFIYMGVLDKEGFKIGLLDSLGNVVVKPISECTVIFSEELAIIAKNKKFGYVDKTGNIVIPTIYGSASDFKYGKATVKLNNETFCINRKGERL